MWKVALGMKAHSGWAALVVLGTRSGELHVVDRRRMDLVENGEASWAKQPYHAAEHLNASDARAAAETSRRAGITTRGLRATALLHGSSCM